MERAASTGSQRKALEQLRDELSIAIDKGESGVLPQLAAQLRQVLGELAILPDEKKVTQFDRIKAQREKRRKAQIRESEADTLADSG